MTDIENKNINNKKVDIWYRFYKNLELHYNITRTQFKEYNFIFVGEFSPYDIYNGEKQKFIDVNEGDNLLPHYLDYFEKSPLKYIDKNICQKLENRFIYKTECVCEIRIERNCFIYSKSKDLLLVIGSECCDRFNENKKQKSCEACSVIHNNRKYNFCNDCKANFYFNCKKCKIDKSNNIKQLKYKNCFNCQFPNYINSTMTTICGTCKKSKPENTFINCYDCNMKKKIYTI
jgi:hypothetical protein